MNGIDLKKALQSVIEQYGRNEDYPVPEIVWSDCNYYTPFGEYQYWSNRIIINRLLNNRHVSGEALKSVIYHEYTHQLIADHDEAFHARMDKYPLYYEHQKTLNSFLENCCQDRWDHPDVCTDYYSPAEFRNDLPLSESEETMVAAFYYKDDDPTSYEDYYSSFDRCTLGYFLKTPLPAKYDNLVVPQMILTVVSNGQVFAVGWAKNVRIYSHDREFDFTRYLDQNPQCHQFKCSCDNVRILMSPSAFSVCADADLPSSFRRSKVCLLSDYSGKTAHEIIDRINAYDGEFNVRGIAGFALDAKSAILSTDAEYIRSLAEKSDSMRALWLMNKAVELEPSFENFKCRAEVHEALSNLSRSINDYQKCLQLAESEGISCPDIPEKINKLKKAHTIFSKDVPM